MTVQIHHLRRRQKYRAHSGIAALLQVRLFISRIFLKILVRSELDGIDKNAHHHIVGAFAFSRLHERNMPLVEIAHRRHQRRAPSAFAQTAAPCLKLFRVAENLHFKNIPYFLSPSRS
jgi:hypothetical protein